ncbi:MAG: universal stress protein, partial [Anaerolineales bacterium]
MNRPRPFELIHKVLVPVIHSCDPTAALTAARLIANEENIHLFGLVAVQGEEALSAGAVPAQQMRKLMRSLPEGKGVQTRVSHEPWKELQELILKEKPDLLIMEWPHTLETLGVSLDEVLSRPICDVALVRGPVNPRPQKILIPLRGGPYSELVLRLALAAEHLAGAKLTSLHIRNRRLVFTRSQRRNAQKRDAAFQGISAVLEHLPEVKQNHLVTDDAGSAIVEYSREADLVIMGSSAAHVPAKLGFGATTQRILNEASCGVMVVKSQRALPIEMQSEMAGQSAISVLVDKWFAENTYHAVEFSDLEHLVELRERQGLTISVAMPALNEEKTVGKVVKTVKTELMEKVNLVDEIVLMDSGSTDSTREIARDLGIPVYIHQEVLPVYGERDGKGEALWKSLYVTRGDILLWIDTDIVNINPRFVYGLIGPLLIEPELQFVKGFYRRPLRVD